MNPHEPVLIRPFTPRQRQIATEIGRGLTYAEIAGVLSRVEGRPVSPATIRTHVRAMAMLIDGADELAPRWRVFVLVKQGEWARARAASVASVASVPTAPLNVAPDPVLATSG